MNVFLAFNIQAVNASKRASPEAVSVFMGSGKIALLLYYRYNTSILNGQF